MLIEEQTITENKVVLEKMHVCFFKAVLALIQSLMKLMKSLAIRPKMSWTSLVSTQ